MDRLASATNSWTGVPTARSMVTVLVNSRLTQVALQRRQRTASRHPHARATSAPADIALRPWWLLVDRTRNAERCRCSPSPFHPPQTVVRAAGRITHRRRSGIVNYGAGSPAPRTHARPSHAARDMLSVLYAARARTRTEAGGRCPRPKRWSPCFWSLAAAAALSRPGSPRAAICRKLLFEGLAADGAASPQA